MTSNKPILDLSQLEEAVGGDEEFIAEILQLFLDTASADMEKLRVAMESGDEGSQLAIVHTLKGSSGNVGGWAMMDKAAEMETQVRQGDSAAIDTEYRALVSVFEQMVQAVRSRLNG